MNEKTYIILQGHDGVAERSGLSALKIAIEKLSMYSSATTTENQVLPKGKVIKIAAINNNYVIYSKVEV
ncbi:hypothetical protein [Vibrio galatheae]|nr:hypothetical protein [Vibrio galatheae]